MEEKKTKALAGWMVICLIVVGVFGFFAAILSFINEYNYIGSGLCLIASAFAFSSVLKAY